MHSLMQIYADVTGRPMKVSRSEQTPALGAAIFGAVAAGKDLGGYATVEEAQRTMTGCALRTIRIRNVMLVRASLCVVQAVA